MLYKTALVKIIVLGITLITTNTSYAEDVEKLYKDHCAVCHNEYRLGGMGPALLPGNLKRLRKKSANDVIRNGRVATQMPPFREKIIRFRFTLCFKPYAVVLTFFLVLPAQYLTRLDSNFLWYKLEIFDDNKCSILS